MFRTSGGERLRNRKHPHPNSLLQKLSVSKQWLRTHFPWDLPTIQFLLGSHTYSQKYNFLEQFIYFPLCVTSICLCLYMYTSCVPGAQGGLGQKRVLERLEPESSTCESAKWTRSSASSCVLYHRALPSSPKTPLLPPLKGYLFLFYVDECSACMYVCVECGPEASISHAETGVTDGC